MERAPETEGMGEGPYELVRLTGFEAADAYDLDAERRYATLMCPAEGGRHGGTGTVREGFTTSFEHVAIKTMTTPNRLFFREDEYEHELSLRLAAFREEYETLKKLRVMRAFPTVYGFGELGDEPAIVMEWIEGTSLAELKGRLTTEQVARLARATYLLLEQVEGQVAVFAHRDLAPGNIIVRTANRPLEEQLETGIFDLCLVDLGSTTVAREVGKSFTTRVGALRGATPGYAAPELLTLETAPETRNNPKVDVYAVASVMWELLTGALPYDDNSVDGLIRTKREGAPEVPSELDEEAAKLARILAKGMDPDQDTRPCSHDMRVWLDEYLAGKPGFWDGERKAAPLITRRKLLFGAGLAAAAVGIAIIVPRISGAARKEDEPSEEPKAESAPTGLDHNAATVSLDTYKGPLLPCLSDQDTWGFITTKSEWAIPPDYRVVNYFSGGLAAVKRDGSELFGYIDTHGDEIIKPQFLDAQAFGQTHLAAVRDHSGAWGYIDRSGEWVIEPTFAGAGEFTEIAPVQDRETGLWGYIDDKGTWLIEPRFGKAGESGIGAGAYRNGLAPVLRSNNTWAYIRANGSMIEKQVFSQAGEFSEGYARVVMESQTEPGYLIDAMFGAYGSNEYTDVGRVSQGMFAARHLNGLWGFGSVSGWRITIPANYRGVGPFVQGVALAQHFATARWGYIDMLGNWVVEPIMANVLDGLIVGGGMTR